MRSLEDEYGLREVSAWPIEPLHMHCAVLQIPGWRRSREPAREAVARSAHQARTTIADFRDPHATTTIPMWACSAAFEQMHVADAHAWSRGEGVKVAIIDTGADTRHPDLAASIAAAANFVDSDSEQFRHDRHGTEIAGVIAAVANNREGIVGVAPESASPGVQGLLAGPDRRRCRPLQFLHARSGTGSGTGRSCASGQSEPRRSGGSIAERSDPRRVAPGRSVRRRRLFRTRRRARACCTSQVSSRSQVPRAIPRCAPPCMLRDARF